MLKQGNLVYLLMAFIVVFLGVVGYFTWKNRIIIHQASITTHHVAQKTARKPDITKATKYDVPILMYHYIRIAPPEDTLGLALSVTPINFTDQMNWLKENNYASIKVSDLADPDKKEISKIIAENKKPIAITFDDGYDDAYTAAFPVLKQDGFTGTFYIIRNFVGRPNYMTQAQIDEMNNAGMEIGSHTLDHLDLAQNSDIVQHKQIFDSKLFATTFCYPSGKYNDSAVNFVKEAGYLTAVTTKPGVSNQDSNLFELPRVRIENYSSEKFKETLQKYQRTY